MVEERLGELQISAARVTHVFSRYPALLHSIRPTG